MSIRWRLTLFNALVILAIGALLLGLMFIVTIRAVTANVRETVQARSVEAVRMLESGTLPTPEQRAQLGADDTYVVIRDINGQIISEAGSPVAGMGSFDTAERDAIWRDVLAGNQAVTVDEHELRVHAVPVTAAQSPARVIEVWKSYDTTAESLIPFVSITTIVIPLSLLLAVTGAYILARSALAPVDAIVRSARNISEEDLSQRLPVSRPNDELGRLASTFNDLLADLEVAFREREESLERQRQFTADASHELRTPLTSIRGYARMLREWALNDPETARESVDAIERESQRMHELVERLLLMAREDEDLLLDSAPTDMRDIASAAVAARRVAATDITIDYQADAEPVIADIDAARIRQVLDILLDNAVKFTPEGGTVRVGVRFEDGVELFVSDDGPGIPHEHLPHIFQRFYKADNARSDGSAGLGLAIARQIVERHGGTIGVSSGANGSTFVVRLPASDR